MFCICSVEGLPAAAEVVESVDCLLEESISLTLARIDSGFL